MSGLEKIFLIPWETICFVVHASDRASLKISKQRTAHQMAVEQQESQKPLRDMTKAEVEEQCLSAYVVIPAALEVAFKEWWQALKSSDVIRMQYPHACHGNTGRKSNSSTHAETNCQRQNSVIFVRCPGLSFLVIATFLFCNSIG